MTGTTITTRSRLEEESGRTGIPIDQLIRIVAKSALIRHIATGKAAADFVLKGGTLLHHCYNSPRFSIIDADFTHRRPGSVGPEDFSAAMALNEEGLVIDFSAVEWKIVDGIWQARVDYSVGEQIIEGYRGMAATVSVRHGEWMDQQKPLWYVDPLLTGENRFQVNGLTLEELSAEKILAWCTKYLGKHAVDLAVVARDHAGIDADKTISLTRRKFDIEGGMPRYKAAGIRDFEDLKRTLLGERAQYALRKEMTAGLWLPRQELARSDTASIRNPEFVERMLREFWLPRL